jgi:hypothetical protein
LIKHRRIIYVHGYDSQGSDGYYRLFRNQLKKFAALWSVKTDLGELVPTSSDIGSWTVTTTGPNWTMVTDYDVVDYKAAIDANMAQPIVWQIGRALVWMFGDLVTGTTFCTFRASWKFGMHHLVLQLGLLTWLALTVGAGVLASRLAHDVLGLNPWAGYAIAAAIAVGVFMALRPLANNWFIVRVNNHWPHLRKFGRGETTFMDRPIEVAAQRLKELVERNDADEILVIGHSGGTPMVLPVMALSLELDPEIGRRGPRVILMTIGSIMPCVAVHPSAIRMREAVRRVAVEPSITWIDCQARADALNFWNFDPVTGIGVNAGPRRCNPLIWRVRFRSMIAPEFYARTRWRMYRIHFQFIMANDMRAPYDYFMLVCGPLPVLEWANRQQQVVAEFSPDGRYLPAR